MVSRLRISFFPIAPLVLLIGCASAPEVRRLNPVPVASKAPQQCKLISVMSGSPADRAGLRVGDTLAALNGTVPSDAWAAGEIVNQAGDTLSVQVIAPASSSRTVAIPLNKNRPRLGAACDLTGFRRHGVTSAGNESQTVFEGPYALTASGIIDKGLMFLRLRVANHSPKELGVSPERFSLRNSTGAPLALLTPREVICDLFGDRGARLLAVKRRRRESADHQAVSAADSAREETCPAGIKPKLKSADAKFVESNADYLAKESLWPVTVKSGESADGLVFLRETTALPVSVSMDAGDRTLRVDLDAKTQTALPDMEAGDLAGFFKTQKKGSPLRVVLKKKNKVFVGRFSSYDDIEEIVWFDTPSGLILNTTQIPLRSIRSAYPVESDK